MPVMTVVDYAMKRISILQKAKFDVVQVYDGQRNPLKLEENKARQASSNIAIHQSKLDEAYKNPESYSRDDILHLQSKIISPRPDITYELISSANEHGIKVICAPFEVDHQFIAL